MPIFMSPVGFIERYNAEVLSTFHGADARTSPEVHEEEENNPTHILLISRKKQRNLKDDCLEKQLFIEHIVKQIDRESIENIFK